MKYELRLLDPDLPANAPPVFETTFEAATMRDAVKKADAFRDGKASLSRLLVSVAAVPRSPVGGARGS
jgi:hypothetical protein